MCWRLTGWNSSAEKDLRILADNKLTMRQKDLTANVANRLLDNTMTSTVSMWGEEISLNTTHVRL